MLSSTFEDEIQQQLAVPLLLNEEPDYNSMNVNSPTRFAAVAAEHHHHGGLAYRLVSIRCVSDTLPLVFYTVLTNGKIAVAALLGAFLILISLWLPFWLLSSR